MGQQRVGHPIVRILRWLRRRNVRGLWRSISLIARLSKRLQFFRMKLPDGRYVYIDLREHSHISMFLWGDTDEQNEIRFVSRFLRRGDVVWDVGAHCGVYSSLMSRIVQDDGRVFAFEPNPRIYKLLQKTASEYPNITPLCVALSNFSGEGVLSEPSLDASMATLSPTAQAYRATKVRITTADEVVVAMQSTPVFVKLDVEGNEFFVIDGAKKLISLPNPPAWLIEHIEPLYLANGVLFADILEIFDNCGQIYSYFYVGSDGRLEPLKLGQKYPSGYYAVIPKWLMSRL